MSGLLIVNADDWGGGEATTDAILGTFEAGRITSASGMVYMPDSDRAAEIAKRVKLPVGLHINLTEPLAYPATPARVRDRQQRLTEKLGAPGPDQHPGTSRLRRWAYDPSIAAEVNRAIADQVERFEELYGGPPTHFDGHNHVDVCPNVFLSGAIPKGSKLRNSLYRYPLERSLGAVLRSARQALRSRRFVSPRYVLHISDLKLPADGNGTPDPNLQRAAGVPVEVMGHPDHAPEHEIFMSPAWGRAMAEHRLGSFADLAASRGGLRAPRAGAAISAGSRSPNCARCSLTWGSCCLTRSASTESSSSHLLVADVEALGVDLALGGQQPDRRLDGLAVAVAAAEDPLEHAAVLAEARPEELARPRPCGTS